jgi:AbrB family looped-hinge helix DNA binding protein
MVAERKPRKAKPRREPVVSVARLTSKNQITIPKAVRDRFNFKAGDDVVFVEDATGTRVRRRFNAERLKKWQGYASDLRSKEDVDAYVDEMRGR